MPDKLIRLDDAIDVVYSTHYSPKCVDQIASNLAEKLKAIPPVDPDPRRPPSDRPTGEDIIVCWKPIAGEVIKRFVPGATVVQVLGAYVIRDRYGQWQCDWHDVLWWEPIRTGPLGG